MQKPQRLLRFLQKEEERKNEKEIIESITCIIKSKYEEKKHINIKFLLSYEKVLCKFSKKENGCRVSRQPGCSALSRQAGGDSLQGVFHIVITGLGNPVHRKSRQL